MTYRIADEVAPGIPVASAKRAPWHPLGIFSLLILVPLFAPIFALFGVVLGALNWARLGQPEKRIIWLGGGLLVILAPLIVLATNPTNPNIAGTVFTFGRLAFASAMLTMQRPLYELYIARGGKSAVTWPLWALALLSVVLTICLNVVLASHTPHTPTPASHASR